MKNPFATKGKVEGYLGMLGGKSAILTGLEELDLQF